MWKVVTFHYESCLQIFRDIEANKREKDATLEICANMECWCFHGVKFVQHSEWDSESTIPAMQIDKENTALVFKKTNKSYVEVSEQQRLAH